MKYHQHGLSFWFEAQTMLILKPQFFFPSLFWLKGLGSRRRMLVFEYIKILDFEKFKVIVFFFAV